MGITAAMGAVKYLPASLGVKLLEKFNPKFKNYFTTAAAYGYDANRALDYLKERFENEAGKSFKGQLAQGERQGTLRPDEKVAKSQLENSEIPGRVARTAAAFGGAALAGGLPAGIAAGASQAAGDTQQNQAPQQPMPAPANRSPQKRRLVDELEEAHQREYGNRRQQPSNADDQLLAAMEQILKM